MIQQRTKTTRLKQAAGFVFITVVMASTEVRASDIDLHWLWDDRCAGCHGHAGDFARNLLRVSNNELQGRHYAQDLRVFLHNHYLAGHEVDAVYKMLFAQATTQARFKGECSGCHGNAAQFVRNTLILCGGVIYSRLSGNDLRGYLTHHQDLAPADVEFFVNLLTRIAHEIYRP